MKNNNDTNKLNREAQLYVSGKKNLQIVSSYHVLFHAFFIFLCQRVAEL